MANYYLQNLEKTSKMKLTKRQLAWLLVHGRNEIQRVFNIIEEEKGKQYYLTTEAEYKTIVGR